MRTITITATNCIATRTFYAMPSRSTAGGTRISFLPRYHCSNFKFVCEDCHVSHSSSLRHYSDDAYSGAKLKLRITTDRRFNCRQCICYLQHPYYFVPMLSSFARRNITYGPCLECKKTICSKHCQPIRGYFAIVFWDDGERKTLSRSGSKLRCMFCTSASNSS